MPLQYVGGNFQQAGGLTTISVSLTGLTGGLSSTAAANDIVIYAIIRPNILDTNLPLPTNGGYTELADLYANDDNDANMGVGYKIMGTTPDTSVDFTSATGMGCAVYVWRGVDTTTPLDVAVTTATGINGNLPTPPAITPVTAGAVVICAAGSGTPYATPGLFTSTDLSNMFSAQETTGSLNGSVGLGSFAWTSGTFTPAQWGGVTSAATNSWVAATLALRPAPTTFIDIDATDSIDLTSTSSLVRVAEMAGTANIALGFDATFVDVVQVAGSASIALTSSSALQRVARMAGTASVSLTATASMVTVGIVLIGASADIALTASASTVAVRQINATATTDLSAVATMGALTNITASADVTLSVTATMTLLWEPGNVASEVWSPQGAQAEIWTDQGPQTATWS